MSVLYATLSLCLRLSSDGSDNDWRCGYQGMVFADADANVDIKILIFADADADADIILMRIIRGCG